ncbi:hypothetical protein NOMA109596_18780 [Nocardioides marinus]
MPDVHVVVAMDDPGDHVGEPVGGPPVAPPRPADGVQRQAPLEPAGPAVRRQLRLHHRGPAAVAEDLGGGGLLRVRAALRHQHRRPACGRDLGDGVLPGVGDHDVGLPQQGPGVRAPAPGVGDLPGPPGGLRACGVEPGVDLVVEQVMAPCPAQEQHATRPGRGFLGDRVAGQAAHPVDPVDHLRGQPGQHRAGHLRRPAADQRVGGVEGEAVGRVGALTRQHHPHHGDAVQAHEQRDLHRHVDDHRGRPGRVEPGRELRRTPGEAGVPAGDPVQASAGGDVAGTRPGHRVVVAGQLHPAAGPGPAPVGGTREGGQPGDRAAVPLGQGPGDRAGTVQVTAAVVVDVVADGAARAAHAATSCWARDA